VIVYLDTSTVLRFLFGEGKRLAGWGMWERAFTSEILGVEARRAIDRARLDGHFTDERLADVHAGLAAIERSLSRVRLTRGVLRRAAMPMPTMVKTLDALHLATAIVLRESHAPELVFATHDRTQATAARALGFECVG